MTSRPRLVRSIPFWVLIVVSLISGIAGGLILTDRLNVMAAALTDGTATGIEVYVGQVEAVFGAILVGAGIVGLALALTVASLRSLVPATPAAAAAAPIDWSAERASSDADVPAGTTTDLPEARTTLTDADEAPAITKTRAATTDADTGTPRH